MLRGARVVGLVAVTLAFTAAILFTRAGAGSTQVEPGLAEAQKVLDCAPGEGVFAYEAAWGEGAGFDTPGQALKGILVGSEFGFSTADFVGRDVEVDTVTATEFTAKSDGRATAVIWAVPVKEGWLADGVYGCTAIAD